MFPAFFRSPGLRASAALVLVALAASLAAAQAPAERPALTLETLFASPEFYGDGFQGGAWAEEGARLLYVDADRATGTASLVQLDLTDDSRTTLIDGATLARPDGTMTLARSQSPVLAPNE